MAHADETDDITVGFGVHAGSGSVAPALAVGELKKATGKQLINAVVLGYDIITRVTKSMDRVQVRKRNFTPWVSPVFLEL